MAENGKAQVNSLNAEKVKHIAHLARIGLSGEEVEKFFGQLDSLITSMEILNEVNTDNVAATTQVTGLKNVMREDAILKNVQADDLLECSTLPKINHQISVKAVIQE